MPRPSGEPPTPLQGAARNSLEALGEGRQGPNRLPSLPTFCLLTPPCCRYRYRYRYRCCRRVDPSEVEPAGTGGGFVLRADPAVRVASRAHKMSKSRGNVINPDDVVWQYGADSLRLYEMFMGPLRDTKVNERLDLQVW